MTTRLFSVTFDSLDYHALARFWSEALEWHLAEEFLRFGEGVVRPFDGGGMEIIFVPTATPKTVKNRLHLDLVSRSPEDHEQAVERLVGLGATHADIGQGDVPWVVLADPEGNEFCVARAEDDFSGRLGAIAFDAADPGAQGRFWADATGWRIEVEGDWGVGLRAPSGEGPALELGPPVAPKPSKNRVHLDLAPDPGDDHGAEVQRLLALGARRVDIGQGDVSWVVLADPEGNEFCVLTPR